MYCRSVARREVDDMQASVIGILVFQAILLASYFLRGSLLTAVMISLPFGSTSVLTLTSLGGSSPLVYTFCAATLLLAVAARRRFWNDVGTVLGQIQATWIVMGLMIYVVVGAVLFPRLFAGQTSAFVPSRVRQGVFEVPLEPVSGNISQTAYFVLGGLTFLALCVQLARSGRLDEVRRAFFLWCTVHTAFGIFDLMGKLAGAGDILAPIRTANYVMLTEASESGFARITGSYSEASAFGGVSLACLAFSYTYWRRTQSRAALGLALTLVLLLILSTSSTAYVGLAILSVPVGLSVGRSLVRGKLSREEIMLLVAFMLGASAIIAVSLYDPSFFDPFVHLIENTVINKSRSGSGQERAYWNYKSLQSFLDTGGFGIGFGSSRASSWPVAVLSQLGLIGALTVMGLAGMLAWGLRGVGERLDPETEAIVASVRASALAGLVSGSLISGSADPGMIFFIALAVVAVSRRVASRSGVKQATASTIGGYATT
jgi:hypothetical protein